MMVANTIASVAEALLLAERGGADPAKVREALLGGFADSAILRQHALRMIAGDFAPGGPARYQVKDTSTAIRFAHSVGLDLPMLNQADQLFAAMLEHGDGDLDHSGIIRELRRIINWRCASAALQQYRSAAAQQMAMSAFLKSQCPHRRALALCASAKQNYFTNGFNGATLVSGFSVLTPFMMIAKKL